MKRALPIVALLLLPGFAAVFAGEASLPAASWSESSSSGLILNLAWDQTGLRQSEGGLYLQLDKCRLEGEAGGPMLPRWRGQIALPPGQSATLTWQVRSSVALAGEPRIFPRVEAVPTGGGGHLYEEIAEKDPAVWARPQPISARLGQVRRLRDLRVIEVVVDPVAWDANSGLRLATDLELRISFRPDRLAPRGQRIREHEPIWEPLYRNLLINGDQAPSWRERPGLDSFAPVRAPRTNALFKVRVEETGIQALPADSLIAHGLAGGTELASIALYRTGFYWGAENEPQFTETAVPRYFLDPDGDGLLDGDETMIFLGHRLKDMPDSPDPVEWYARAGCYMVAAAPDLAQEMGTRAGWEDETSYDQPSSFERHLFLQGEEAFFPQPPQHFYLDSPIEEWNTNLYYLSDKSASLLELEIPSPSYVEGTEAHLEVLFQGATEQDSDSWRFFSLELDNDTVWSMPGMQVQSNDDTLYSEPLGAGMLVDGTNTLRIDRIDSHAFFVYIKHWDLAYRSSYTAGGDSLHFNAGGLTGAVQIEVDSLSRGWGNWILLREDGGSPESVTLSSINQAGGAGDYHLVFRDAEATSARWWLADKGQLHLPDCQEPGATAFLSDGSACDVLVIVHDDFHDGMARWVDYREQQGYTVRVLRTSEVYEAFGSGLPSARAVQHAVRYAWQNWGAEALVLVGDASTDARDLSQYTMPNYVPMHAIHEKVGGVNELVGLDEWVCKSEPSGWPNLIMGRIPVGTTEELEIFLDKLECFEATGPCAGAEDGDDDWRRRFLIISDDCYSYDEIGGVAYCHNSELDFEEGQEGVLELIAGCVVADSLLGAPAHPDQVEGFPFFESVITHPWYEEHPGATWSEIQNYLRPIIAPLFTDSLSQGWIYAATQSHANRNQLGHEMYLKTDYMGNDQENVLNYWKPFLWAVYGCHGNDFDVFNEASLSAGDCIGEKLMFLPDGRGAIGSYASTGFEYLDPNVSLGQDLVELMFRVEDSEGVLIFPSWTYGSLLLLSELRYSGYTSSYRYNWLGDPLTRVNPAPPRIRLFQDGEELFEGDYISVLEPSDTMRIDIRVSDENYISTLELRDTSLGEIEFEATALTDTLAADSLGLARSWLMTTQLPFDFNLDTLVVEATDEFGAVGDLRIPLLKMVEFETEDAVALDPGQWIASSGAITVRIGVPVPSIPPGDFSLRADGAATTVQAEETDDELVYGMEYVYDWAPGEHTLEVLYLGQPYGAITLVVDASIRLLEGVIYPNPFRNSIHFHYELTGRIDDGKLDVYTISGRRVYSAQLSGLAEGMDHIEAWDGRDNQGDRVANGVYICRLTFTPASGDKLIWQDKIVRMR